MKERVRGGCCCCPGASGGDGDAGAQSTLSTANACCAGLQSRAAFHTDFFQAARPLNT